MKNRLTISALCIVATILTYSCQKESFVPEISTSKSLTFTSVKPVLEDETKTAWTGSSIQWSNGDAIRVAYTRDGVWQNADGTATADEARGSKTAKVYKSNSLSADAETARFTVPGDFTGTAAGTYVFYGAYPASACTDGSNFKYAPSLTVTIPETQTPAADSFDSAADFMLGTSANTYTGIPTEAVSMSWDRMVAHAQLTFKTLNGFTARETIRKVELTADSEADMVGKHFIDLETKNVTKPSGTVANALTINGTNLSVDETGTFVAWASFLPCTVKSLTVVVTTDKATYTREIASCELVFKKNARNVLTVNMSSAIRAAIVGAPLPFEETFEAITEGDSASTGGSSTNVTDVQMANFSNYATNTYQAGEAVRIGKSGFLETKNLDLSKNFYVVVTAKGWSQSEVNLTVSAGEQSETLTLETYIGGDYKDYIVYFNAVSSTSTVKFTTNSSTRCFIDQIRIAEGSDTRTPLATPDVTASLNSEANNSIDVSWGVVANAGSYVVTATPASGIAVSKTVDATSCTISGLEYETVYTISVVAKPSDTSLYLDSAAGEAEPVNTGANLGGETKVTFTMTTGGDLSSGTSVTKNGITVAGGQGSYSSNISVGGTYTKVYAGNTLTISGKTGTKIKKVVFTASSSSYIKTWSADDSSSCTVSEDTMTWNNSTGVESVIFTNTASAQARIKTIVVTYE